MPKQVEARDEQRWEIATRLFQTVNAGCFVPEDKVERETAAYYRKLEQLEKKKKPPAK